MNKYTVLVVDGLMWILKFRTRKIGYCYSKGYPDILCDGVEGSWLRGGSRAALEDYGGGPSVSRPWEWAGQCFV